MKTRPINGWTKKSMIDHIKRNFTGKSVTTDITRGAWCGLSCMYKSEVGNKCAAGLFIPDGLYDKEMEGQTISVVCKGFPEVAKHMPLNETAMQYFQQVHDNSNPEKTLEDMLAWIEKSVEGES